MFLSMYIYAFAYPYTLEYVQKYLHVCKKIGKDSEGFLLKRWQWFPLGTRIGWKVVMVRGKLFYSTYFCIVSTFYKKHILLL